MEGLCLEFQRVRCRWTAKTDIHEPLSCSCIEHYLQSFNIIQEAYRSCQEALCARSRGKVWSPADFPASRKDGCLEMVSDTWQM